MSSLQKNILAVIKTVAMTKHTQVRISANLNTVLVINDYRSVPNAELTWDSERSQYLVRLIVTPDERSQKCGVGYAVMAVKGLLSANDFVAFYRILVRHRANKKK